MFNNLSDMPMLDGYRAAKQHHDAIKPLTRGKNAGLRPLCNTPNGRKKTHYLIHEISVSDTLWGGQHTNGIACQLYDTDVLIFTENGYVYVDNSYVSMTTNGFASSILPYHCSMHSAENKVWLHDRYHNKHWYVPDGERVLFKLVEGGMTPVRPVPIKKHLVNMANAEVIYKEFAPFIKHVSAIHKIVDPEAFMSAEVDQTQGRNWGRDRWKHEGQYAELNRCDIMKDVENKEGWGELTKYYLTRSGVRDSRIVEGSWTMRWEIPLTDVRKDIRHTIKTAYADRMFDEVDAPLGLIAKDPNEEYFR